MTCCKSKLFIGLRRGSTFTRDASEAALSSAPYQPASKWMYCKCLFAAKSTSSFAPFVESVVSRMTLPGLIQLVFFISQGSLRFKIRSLFCNNCVAFSAIIITCHGVANGVVNSSFSYMEQTTVFGFVGCRANFVRQ
ncbi:hypothetical protein SDC9_97981 [bioreactor metagenome]|uniref:Uncharacterized protein n=1 Tax=bioreactor metagenome TaxID=1076179 RepID=A0A645AK41_9ZZZZ